MPTYTEFQVALTPRVSVQVGDISTKLASDLSENTGMANELTNGQTVLRTTTSSNLVLFVLFHQQRRRGIMDYTDISAWVPDPVSAR